MRIATDRGIMTGEMLNGDGLLYFYKPYLPFTNKPWVKIDSLGYRNNVEVKDAVDAVFLGDSVTFTGDTHKDFADLFRDRGFTAFNLALGGYGTYQHRDAYKRFVIEPGLEHRYLIMILTGENDFEESLGYARTLAKGGDYQVYLGKRVGFLFGNIDSTYFPWVASILLNKIPDIKDVLTGRRSITAEGIIRLPNGDLPASGNILRLDPVKGGDLTWLYFKKAMDEILAMASDRGVKTLVAYHPPSRVVYGPLLDGHEEFKKTLEKNHRNLMALLAPFLDRPNVRFRDLAAFEQAAVAREKISAPLPTDIHLNARGIELIAGELLKELQQMND